MAAVRPVVTVFGLDGAKVEQVKAPAVFSAPIRSDIIAFVHTNMAKNRRQPYAVKHMAGMGHSAESWGTGRAVARIPRVSGGGTSRSGQAAFGNMCRKGRMFAPTKIWRKWHRKTSVNQKRYAVASAVAASALPALVMARGHAVGKLPEVPLVVENAVESIKKTKAAVAALKALGAEPDVIRAKNSRSVRTGVARMRNRTHTSRRGPLVVYNEDNGIVKAFRNLPGVEVVNVNSLNLLQLAPGGHIGRFIIWTKGAVEALHNIFGSVNRVSTSKGGFHIPANVMSNTDLDRIINSNEIQSKLRGTKKSGKAQNKKNPLRNFSAMVKLNPYALFARRAEVAQMLRNKAVREANLEAVRAGKPVERTPGQIKKRAQQKAAKAQSKLNAKRIVSGYVATPEEAKAAKFSMEKYAAAMKVKVVGPTPVAKPFSLPKSIVTKAANGAAMKAAVAAKAAKNLAMVNAAIKKSKK